MAPHDRGWAALERWSPTLFLVGGGLVVGHAAVRAIDAFAATAPPPDVFGPPGYLLGIMGLLGLYPALADRQPWLARVAAFAAVVPLGGWVAISALTFAEVAGLLGSSSGPPLGSFFLVHLVAFILAYALFGIASLRVDVHPHPVGVLVLAPAVLMSALLVAATVLGDSTLGAFVIGSGQATVHLAIGSTLRARAAMTGAASGDATAG